MKDLRDERLEAANRLRWMVPECGAYPLGEIGSAIMGGSFTVSELRDHLIWLLSGDMGEDGKTPVPDANGTADGATASGSGLSWLDSAALAECRRLTAENAALAERNAELRAALDEQGDELAALRREAASVPTELESGRLLIVADSIASDGEGLRTIEAYGRFFEREDGGRDGWMKLPVDMDGIPIRPDDEVEVNAEGYDVFAVTVGRWVDVDGCTHDPMQTRHVKPRTLEDVLSDFAARVLNSGHQWGLDAGKATAECAEEIRKLTEVAE